ncbi:MAG: hypothetical protein ACM32I_11885 [Nitrospirota bacterium]|jgi:hypothetical protein
MPSIFFSGYLSVETNAAATAQIPLTATLINRFFDVRHDVPLPAWKERFMNEVSFGA